MRSQPHIGILRIADAMSSRLVSRAKCPVCEADRKKAPPVAQAPPIISSHEQDLTDTTLLCLCLSLSRFTEWHFQADRDY